MASMQKAGFSASLFTLQSRLLSQNVHVRAVMSHQLCLTQPELGESPCSLPRLTPAVLFALKLKPKSFCFSSCIPQALQFVFALHISSGEEKKWLISHQSETTLDITSGHAGINVYCWITLWAHGYSLPSMHTSPFSVSWVINSCLQIHLRRREGLLKYLLCMNVFKGELSWLICNSANFSLCRWEYSKVRTPSSSTPSFQQSLSECGSVLSQHPNLFPWGETSDKLLWNLFLRFFGVFFLMVRTLQ